MGSYKYRAVAVLSDRIKVIGYFYSLKAATKALGPTKGYIKDLDTGLILSIQEALSKLPS